VECDAQALKAAFCLQQLARKLSAACCAASTGACCVRCPLSSTSLVLAAFTVSPHCSQYRCSRSIWRCWPAADVASRVVSSA
jgi:hypothetical protein